MAFDFNSVNDTKNKPIVKAMYEARFSLSFEKFLEEVKQYCLERKNNIWNNVSERKKVKEKVLLFLRKNK